MFCSNCGNELENSDNFCPSCGQSTNKNPESKTPFIGISDEKPIQEKKPSNNWSVTTILVVVFLIFVGSGVLGGFIDGMSSSTASPSETVNTDNQDKFLDNLGGYSNVIVESQWEYEYNQHSNERIIVNCYFDFTNIGTATADNVQVDYSILFDGRVLETSTIYLGSIPAGSSLHREKGQSVNLNSFEWNDLIDEEEKIEVSIDEVRSE